MYQRMVLLTLPKVHSIDIEFKNVTYEARIGFRGPLKQILKGISGNFKTGELTAIMGPSGAGKSTLLNILTGFQRDNWKGEIDYIGCEGKHTWNEYRKQSCYIQQDDKFYPLFTVLESMWIAVNLKIGSSLSTKAKEMLIDDVLENLDLIKTKQTKCERLSGGQKKRLSIALELVDNPPVMFLDEPTTGLDALSSSQLIRLLHSLAKAGRTIVCTIHQPSAVVYETFDNVYLLAEGRCMYEGATKNTVAYFASVGLQCPKYHNPADFMIEVVSKEYGDFNDQLEKQVICHDSSWRSDAAQITKKEPKINESKATVLIQAPSEIDRFFVLMNRCMVLQFRDWTTTHLKMFLHLLVGILLGLLFSEAGRDGDKTISNVAYFLFSCVYLCYTSMMPAVLKFPTEMSTLKKERFNNWYQLRTYYIASLICSIPIQMLFAFIYSVTSYFISNQPMDANRFLMYLMVSIMLALVADSFGLLIGTMTDPVNGTFIGAILLATFSVLSGFLALYNHMPRALYYLSYVDYLRYCLHGYVTALYGFGREKLECSQYYCHYSVPETLLSDLAMIDGRYWLDIVLLILNCAFYRFITYCTLKRRLAIA
ncbi:ATP-binding cassette sub-family G member 1 [Ceratina calcarata]|uniref:ATP-binding cassette sub-family G member 1 n=1 Tax=Ceratina calcarata TaxID=156304 RepID=A0AAJ7J608_9HYME|nr:ATP-binding cassette sub-family G member 1 [Ceratina calcarata]XP_017885033.1 ATP-binding cassette sub-family G member 1 [Ceratina calcarata]XP_017885034.1 ATP-binding cassette sub-family G member 1 [Ceratina calcarata]XP_017885035.1 ATP-binding cassette sub-family G member 1 [Ceratina calcarata]